MRIFLVENGEFISDSQGGHLTEEGRLQAEAATDELRAKDLGRSVFIISACAGSTSQTAGVVRYGLGLDQIIFSKRISDNRSKEDKDYEFRRLLCEELRDKQVPCSVVDGIIAVTHSVVISDVLSHPFSTHLREGGAVTTPGGVYEYTPAQG